MMPTPDNWSPNLDRLVSPSVGLALAGKATRNLGPARLYPAPVPLWSNPMNPYRPVRVGLHCWAVEWFVDGISHGFTLGFYWDEAEALYIAHVFARMEMLAAPR